jgi:hypothetical protein
LDHRVGFSACLLCRADFDTFNSTLFSTTGYFVSDCEIILYGKADAALLGGGNAGAGAGAASVQLHSLILTAAVILAVIMVHAVQ